MDTKGQLFHQDSGKFVSPTLRDVGIYLRQLSWSLTEAFLCIVKTILTNKGAQHLYQQQNAFHTPADGRGT